MKWSAKTEKNSIVADDEVMIIDSEDANDATKNKRVKLSAFGASPGVITFQTVGATTHQLTFPFTNAISLNLVVVAGNATNTKGYTAEISQWASHTIAVNNININATDFATANTAISNTTDPITIDFNGEAGETINWKVLPRINSI